MNLFQPGKKNARQHRHAPAACVALHHLCSASSVLGIRLAAGAIAISPPQLNAWCFGLLCQFLLSLFQSCANVPQWAWDCAANGLGYETIVLAIGYKPAAGGYWRHDRMLS